MYSNLFGPKKVICYREVFTIRGVCIFGTRKGCLGYLGVFVLRVEYALVVESH